MVVLFSVLTLTSINKVAYAYLDRAAIQVINYPSYIFEIRGDKGLLNYFSHYNGGFKDGIFAGGVLLRDNRTDEIFFAKFLDPTREPWIVLVKCSPRVYQSIRRLPNFIRQIQ